MISDINNWTNLSFRLDHSYNMDCTVFILKIENNFEYDDEGEYDGYMQENYLNDVEIDGKGDKYLTFYNFDELNDFLNHTTIKNTIEMDD